MKQIGISDFKARCIAILKDAQEEGTPFVVTRRGKPLCRVVPLPADKPRIKLGALAGTGTILGDIIESDMADDWADGLG